MLRFTRQPAVLLTALAAVLASITAQAASAPSYPTAVALGAKDLADTAAGCPDPKLTVEPVRISTGVEGAILHYTSREPACMGAAGEYQSLAVKGVDGRWRTALSANPQIIKVAKPHGAGLATLSVYSVAGCTGTYTWTGRRYVERRQVTGGICGNGPFPASLHVLEDALNKPAVVTDATAFGALPTSDPDPVRTVRAVIGQVDRLPCWCDSRFGPSVTLFATSDLIHAVEHGNRVARAKKIDLWDADLFTGQQNIKSAKLLSGRLISQTENSATVLGRLAIVYADGSIYPPVDLTYALKREGGVWKIDDFSMAKTPSVKHIFLHPEEGA